MSNNALGCGSLWVVDCDSHLKVYIFVTRRDKVQKKKILSERDTSTQIYSVGSFY